MNIQSLKYFYEIAKAGNISSVAQSVHISQSALSQQVQKLENILGKKLLDRSNKGVSLTSTGKIVYKFAENILRTYDEMMDELDRNERNKILIRIKATPAIADYALPCTLIKAKKAYSYHRYELTSSFASEIIADVQNNVSELGFIYSSGDKKHYGCLKHTKIGIGRIMLVARYDEQIPESIHCKDIKDHCIVTFSGKNEVALFLRNQLSNYGINHHELESTLEVESIEGAKKLVSRGYGMAFLPYTSIREELYKKQFKKIDVLDLQLDMQIDLLYRNDCDEYTKEFIDWFKKNGTNSFC